MGENSKNVTIRDIAAACGVTPATVSLALRNHPRISAKTKAAVTAAAEQLGYKRHPMVAALMSNIRKSRQLDASERLAAVYNRSQAEAEGSAYQRNLWAGMQDRARMLGFSVDRFFLPDLQIQDSGRLTEILCVRGIRGVLVPPLARAGGHLSLDWSQFCAVAMGYSMMRPELLRVCPDQYQGIRLAMRQIRRYGYSRPGLIINAHSGLRTLHLWSSGFYGSEYARKKRGVIPVLECGEVDMDQVMGWYEKHRPDIIISSGTDAALWKALKKTKLRIPAEVGFVTLSRRDMYREVAGINENEYRVGSVAVDQLTHLLYQNERGITDHPCVIQIPPSWEDGATCVKQASNP